MQVKMILLSLAQLNTNYNNHRWKGCNYSCRSGNAFDLNASYFKTKIIEASALGKLSGNDVFKEYFRGLYFKVEKSGSSPSAMALLDFKREKLP
jgi:hypothetical protein